MTKKEPRQNTSRYVIAWLLILAIVCSVIGVVFYNINAVMMLFGKGHVNLKSFSDLRQTVLEQPNTYRVIENEQLADGTQLLSYKLVDGWVAFWVTADQDGRLQDISGEIDLEKIQPFQIADLYKVLNDSLKPFCQSRDILAAEVAIIKYVRGINLVSYANPLMHNIGFGNNDIVVQKQANSFTIYFDVVPKDPDRRMT